MPAIRSLLLLLLLPALLLPEGVPVCLHFLLCREQATSGCCKEPCVTPPAHAGCTECTPHDDRDRRGDGGSAEVATPRADCCVAAPGACLLPALERPDGDPIEATAAKPPRPPVAPFAVAYADHSARGGPVPRATSPPWFALGSPARYAATALPLRL